MKPYSTDMREAIIRQVNLGEMTQEEIAEAFGVSVRCIQYLMRLYRETGEVLPRKIGRPEGTGKIPLDKLEAFVAKHPDATLEEIRKGCKLNASLPGICKALKRLGLSRKKKVVHASEQDRPDVREKRQEWLEKSHEMPANHLVFVDQTGINTRMGRDYGRAPVGERVIGAIPERHYLSSTLMGALRMTGEFVSLVYNGATDVAAMLAFINSQLAPVLKPGDIVVWDNLQPHHSPLVIQAIEKTGARVCPLPAYSPDLNPIEKLWSKLKQLLRGVAARTQEALLHGLNVVLKQVTPQDIQHWFEHCGYTPTLC